MRNMSGFKCLALAGLLPILILAALSMQADGEPQEQPAIGGKSAVSINVKGVAVGKTDGGWGRKDLDMSLTLNLGERRENIIPVEAVEGRIIIDGTTYDVAEARGVVLYKRNIIVLRLGCDDGSVSIVLHMRYFRMGGGLYALRGSGVSRVENGGMRILFRGTARLS